MMKPEDILLYETHASWWTGWCYGDFLQTLAAKYFAWKVRRKYRRYVRSMKIAEVIKTRRLLMEKGFR